MEVLDPINTDVQSNLQAWELRMPPAIVALLKKRGVDSEESFQRTVYPKFDQLKDPYSILGIAQAVNRLLQARNTQEKICIYADYDLDGTSGLAMMYFALKRLGYENLTYFQPARLAEGYGFHANVVQELANQSVTLIITVDVGITSIPACQTAKELGIDVILTDHHLPGQDLPPAFVILNPNQDKDTSGLNYLCGAGVAFYFLRALLRRFKELSISTEFNLLEVLDFFTIATLTDMVPLIDDNRVLIRKGLEIFHQTRRPGLRSLLQALNLNQRNLSAQDLAIRFAPKLNALSRLDRGIRPIDVYLCEEEQKAQQLTLRVLDNNLERQQLQESARRLAHEFALDQKDQDFIFVVSHEFHRGIVGLVASYLVEEFGKPSLVGSLTLEDQIIVGSARLPQASTVNLVEALKTAESVLSRFGGHAAAAGFELHSEHQRAFCESLKSYFFQSGSIQEPKAMFFDLDLSFTELTPQFYECLVNLGPFGKGFEVPIFKSTGVQIKSLKKLKGVHLKLELFQNQSGECFEALLFSPNQKQADCLQDWENKKYELIYEAQWNYFSGNRRRQLIIRDIRLSAIMFS